MGRRTLFMNAKKRKAAITAILLAETAATEAWPDAPSNTSNENVCRGSFYYSPGHSAAPLKRPHAARGNICLNPAACARTPAQCRIGDFTGSEAGLFTGATDQREAGTIPVRFF